MKQTSTFNTISGNLYAIFYYKGETGTPDTITTSIDKIDAIKYPFESNPGTPAYSSTKIHLKKDSDLDAFLTAMESAGKETQIFVHIMLNSSILYHGIIDWDGIEKKDYYIDATDAIDYRNISISLDDCIMYFDRNAIALSDLSLSGSVKTCFDTIFAELGYASTDVLMDAWGISEENGTNYDLRNLTVEFEDDEMLVSEWLKTFALATGLFIYSLKGKIYIIRRDGGVSVAITRSDVQTIKKIKNPNLIKQVSVGAKYLENLCPSVDWWTIENTKTFGQSANDQKVLSQDCTSILSRLSAATTTGSLLGNWLTWTPVSVSRGAGYIKDLGEDFLSMGIESGDHIYFFWNTTVDRAKLHNHPTLTEAQYYKEALVTSVAEHFIYYDDPGIDTDANRVIIVKGSIDPSRYDEKRYKTVKLLEASSEIYRKYYLSDNPEILQLILDDLDAYTIFHSQYSFLGEDYKIANASIDIAKDKITLNLVDLVGAGSEFQITPGNLYPDPVYRQRGNWDDVKDYRIWDLTLHDYVTWLAIGASSGVEPGTDNMKWVVWNEASETTLYYIKMMDGNSFRNGTGSITIEAHKIEAGTDTILSSGDVMLYDEDDNVITEANGYAAGSDGYTGIFEPDNIIKSLVVSLKDADGIKDSVTLVDVNDGPFISIEDSNGLLYKKDKTGSWNTTSNTVLDATLYLGAAVGTKQVTVSLNSTTGILTATATGTPTGKPITATISNNNSKAVQVEFWDEDLDIRNVVTVVSVFDGEKGDTGDTGPQGVQGEPGADGDPTYTWIKYADDASGTGLSNDPTGKLYIGFAYNKSTATESTTPGDYTWSLIKGDTGDQGVPGDPGADGETTYTWIKYSANSDGSSMTDTPQSNTEYIGIAVNKTTPTESTDPADYVWSKFKGDKGDTGDTGATGTTGDSGPAYRYLGAWESGGDYVCSDSYIDVVESGDYAWECILSIDDETTAPPSDTTHWKLFGDAFSKLAVERLVATIAYINQIFAEDISVTGSLIAGTSGGQRVVFGSNKITFYDSSNNSIELYGGSGNIYTPGSLASGGTIYAALGIDIGERADSQSQPAKFSKTGDNSAIVQLLNQHATNTIMNLLINGYVDMLSLKINGTEVIDSSGNIKTLGTFKSSDGTSGISTTKSWYDPTEMVTHSVTVKDGIITSWSTS